MNQEGHNGTGQFLWAPPFPPQRSQTPRCRQSPAFGHRSSGGALRSLRPAVPPPFPPSAAIPSPCREGADQSRCTALIGCQDSRRRLAVKTPGTDWLLRHSALIGCGDARHWLAASRPGSGSGSGSGGGSADPAVMAVELDTAGGQCRLRPFSCELGLLSRPDGSAAFLQGLWGSPPRGCPPLPVPSALPGAPLLSLLGLLFPALPSRDFFPAHAGSTSRGSSFLPSHSRRVCGAAWPRSPILCFPELPFSPCRGAVPSPFHSVPGSPHLSLLSVPR